MKSKMIMPFARFRPRAIHHRALFDFATSTASTGHGTPSVSSRIFFSQNHGLKKNPERSRTNRAFDGRKGILTNALPFQLGPSKSRWNFYSNQRARVPRMSECHTLEEAVEATHDHLDILSPRDVAAFWAVVPKFIQKRNRAGMVNRGGRGEGRQMRQQFEAILCHTIEGIISYGSRDLAQTTLAFAKIVKNVGVEGKNVPNDSPRRILHDLMVGADSEDKHFIFQEATLASMPILEEFEPRQLSNFIYAFGLAGHNHEFEDGSTFFDMLALAAIPNLKMFTSQGLSNMLLAYAYVGASNSQLFKKAGDVIVRGSLKTFEEQHIANITWAHAKVNERHPKLFKKVADHMMELGNLGGFNPQNLSNIVWAFATLNEPHPNLFQEVAEHIMSLHSLGGFNPQNLSNIVWAYATAKEYQPTLFQKLAEAAIQRKAELNSQDVANFLWAHAANGHLDVTLFQTLAPMAEARLDECNEQHLTNIAWAFAVVNICTSSLFDEHFAKACKDKEHEFSGENLRQLHQWQIWQEELKSHITLHPPLSERCRKAFVSRVPRPSALQDDVVSELKAMGLQPEEEVLTKRGYRLDSVVKVKGNKIGIEVDGPSHFIDRRPTGSTILKRRQVANVEGLPVVSVPYWEWNRLKRDSNKKQEYLCSLLDLSQS